MSTPSDGAGKPGESDGPGEAEVTRLDTSEAASPAPDPGEAEGPGGTEVARPMADPAPARRRAARRRKRWPMGLAAVIGFLLAGSVVLAVLNARRLEGSVPGKAPILGLAAVEDGFLIGTADGMLKSTDGLSWEPVDAFEGEVLVASAGSTAVVVADGKVSLASNLEEFTPSGAELDDPTAVSMTPQGQYWIADREANLLITGDAGGSAPSDISLSGGPQEVLSLAVVSGNGTEILAGGLTSGLWRFDGTWQRILGTPIRAILADPASPDRYFLGTSGGVLVAGRTAPEFTDLRIPVEALTEANGTYYAITSDRLLYESKDGTTWTARAAEGR